MSEDTHYPVFTAEELLATLSPDQIEILDRAAWVLQGELEMSHAAGTEAIVLLQHLECSVDGCKNLRNHGPQSRRCGKCCWEERS